MPERRNYRSIDNYAAPNVSSSTVSCVCDAFRCGRSEDSRGKDGIRSILRSSIKYLIFLFGFFTLCVLYVLFLYLLSTQSIPIFRTTHEEEMGWGGCGGKVGRGVNNAMRNWKALGLSNPFLILRLTLLFARILLYCPTVILLYWQGERGGCKGNSVSIQQWQLNWSPSRNRLAAPVKPSVCWQLRRYLSRVPRVLVALPPDTRSWTRRAWSRCQP